MSADSYVMCYFKANIQHYFVNVSVQRRKAVIAMQCPLVESKHKADVFHFSLYLQPFIGSNHKDGVPLTSCHSCHHFTHYNALITSRLRKVLKVTATKNKNYLNVSSTKSEQCKLCVNGFFVNVCILAP